MKNNNTENENIINDEKIENEFGKFDETSFIKSDEEDEIKNDLYEYDERNEYEDELYKNNEKNEYESELYKNDEKDDDYENIENVVSV
jgi:hypothetical protein